MLRIAICEDLKNHRRMLKEALETAVPEEYIVEEFSSIETFRAYYDENDLCFDIILMDIELEDGSGIEFSSEINRRYPLAQIIYTTAYTEYFSDVYDTAHVWFIQKKDLNTYLPKAILKACKSLDHLKSLHLNFSWQKMKYSIVQDEIIFIERRLHVSEIHTATEVYKTSEKLDELMKRLTSSFTLCHRSYIINMKYITKINKSIIVLNDMIELPVSRAKEQDVKREYAMFLVH